MFTLDRVLRTNIKNLKAYSSARSEFSGEASIYLDANENPYNAPFNRYPDPMQKKLKERIAEIKKIEEPHIFLGNGSDEAIDILFRAFCEPKKDNVITVSPTYGMYQVCADINDTPVIKINLNDDFTLDAKKVLDACTANTKLIFICSPNNPSGNLLDSQEIEKILTTFKGIVVIDEAYIDFSPEATWLNDLQDFPNLVLLQTFSKAWGMAGIRLGMAFASEEIIKVFNKIKYPYNVNMLTQQLALELLADEENMLAWVEVLNSEKEILKSALQEIEQVIKIYPSDANFLLVKMTNARNTYDTLVQKGTIVRDRSKVELCDKCLRITIGTPEENQTLIEILKSIN